METTMDGKLLAIVLAAASLMQGCRRSSGHDAPETKIDVLPISFRAEVSTNKPIYSFGEPFVLEVALSNFSSASVFSSEGADCGAVVPIEAKVVDSLGQTVLGLSSDCVDPSAKLAIHPGETIRRSIQLDAAPISGQPLPAGDYLIEASIDLRGPLASADACYSEGILTVCAPGALSVSRIPVSVVAEASVASSGAVLPVFPFRVFAQADRPFYASGESAKLQTVLENSSDIDLYGMNLHGCDANVEIFAVEGLSLQKVKSGGVCPAVIIPVSLPSGSILKTELTQPLVDDQEAILPAGFYVIRVTTNLSAIGTVPPSGASQGSGGGSGISALADHRPSVDIAIRIF